jgi:hypothetical protein
LETEKIALTSYFVQGSLLFDSFYLDINWCIHASGAETAGINRRCKFVCHCSSEFRASNAHGVEHLEREELLHIYLKNGAICFELHNTSETLTTQINPTPRSIFENCAGKSSRLTKSPQVSRCRREHRLPLKAQTLLNPEKFAPTGSRTQDLRCYQDLTTKLPFREERSHLKTFSPLFLLNDMSCATGHFS